MTKLFTKAKSFTYLAYFSSCALLANLIVFYEDHYPINLVAVFILFPVILVDMLRPYRYMKAPETSYSKFFLRVLLMGCFAPFTLFRKHKEYKKRVNDIAPLICALIHAMKGGEPNKETLNIFLNDKFEKPLYFYVDSLNIILKDVPKLLPVAQEILPNVDTWRTEREL